ncbi:MAG: ATPase [Acidobacteriota bacterium]|nr:ATPase [Acidobacteriota bacterium]
MTNYYLGVDGGQSSTIAVIGDEAGRVVAWASAGPCNHVGAREGRAKFLRVMRECLTQAAARAAIHAPKPHFHAACLGMSGGPGDKESLLHELMDAEHLVVTHDGRIALAGATAGRPGAIVIAGTGSIAFGENSHGETARAGGWGYIFGDEGGGFDIVRQALRVSLREYEGWGPRTALTPALLEAAGCANANELLHVLYTAPWPRSRTAALAVLVGKTAEAGDPAAVDILHTAAHHLAELAGKVRAQLWRDDEPSTVSWIGGVFKSEILLQRFRHLVELEGHAATAPPQHSPALGALLIARKAAGLPPVPLEPGEGIKI